MSKPRGHVLSGQQVRLSGEVVSLTERLNCSTPQPKVSLVTDPGTGDVLEIHVECSCGEHIVLDCHYDGEFAIRET